MSVWAGWLWKLVNVCRRNKLHGENLLFNQNFNKRYIGNPCEIANFCSRNVPCDRVRTEKYCNCTFISSYLHPNSNVSFTTIWFWRNWAAETTPTWDLSASSLRVTGVIAAPLRVMGMKPLSGIVTVMGPRVAYHQEHNMFFPLLTTIKKYTTETDV